MIWLHMCPETCGFCGINKMFCLLMKLQYTCIFLFLHFFPGREWNNGFGNGRSNGW